MPHGTWAGRPHCSPSKPTPYDAAAAVASGAASAVAARAPAGAAAEVVVTAAAAAVLVQQRCVQDGEAVAAHAAEVVLSGLSLMIPVSQLSYLEVLRLSMTQ